MARLTQTAPLYKDPMVTAEWLSEHLDHDDVIAIDATWCMPGIEEPLSGQSISGVAFDIDEIADCSSALPHMLPTPEQFQSQVRTLGINQNSHIICYDRHGMFSAPRAWWMLRAMGHENVQVLDGGLPAWISLGLSVKSTCAKPVCGNFRAKLTNDLVRNNDDVKEALCADQVLDARPSGRFDGTAPEPRAGLSSGHMPGASNIPFGNLFNNGFLRTKPELALVFKDAGIDLETPIISTCGSGITACGIALALARLGVWDTPVYDGSWVEWASTPDCPIEKAG